MMSLNIAVGDFVYPKKSSLDLSSLKLLIDGGEVTSINEDGVASVVRRNGSLSVRAHVSHLCKPTDPDALEPYID